MALNEAGIKFYAGVTGGSQKAVEALLADNLVFDPNAKCTHHEKEHNGETHQCGANGCGKGNCGNH